MMEFVEFRCKHCDHTTTYREAMVQHVYERHGTQHDIADRLVLKDYKLTAQDCVEASKLIESLRKNLAECQKECEEQARLNGMGSEREAALMARLKECERDAKRYRWLRSVDSPAYTWIDGDGLYKEELDAAIDAALAKVGADKTGEAG